MTIDDKDLLNSILSSLSRIDYIKPDTIPNIDLYMDQVTTFMDTQLAAAKRHPEDKVLTKTMINNYTKDNLLPPPNKKKYSKAHMLTLIFIYYFKNILSINDLQQVLHPLIERFFNEEQDLNLTDIYNEVFSLEKDEVTVLAKDITKKFQQSSEHFLDAPEEDREMLQNFSIICMLSFDVFVKKMLIEKMIDLNKASIDEAKKEAKENKKDERKDEKKDEKKAEGKEQS